ncbi:MAG: cysteine desulfurase [Acidobacteriota bacterium]|jgi:cysteine desulfurase
MAMPIYMDYNATTPVDPRVVEAMRPAFEEHFGNPASRTHPYGWAAARLVEKARASLASLLGGNPDEFIFTSGATEANNLAIKGAVWARTARSCHVITCTTEHKAVLDPCRRLARDGGVELTVLPVDRLGRVDPQRLAEALRPDTGLVSLMLANNETGTLHPLPEVARICRQRGVLLHTDATQAVGKIPVNVHELGVDLLSLSAHKFYGPKGIGALWRRRGVPLVPLLDGGGHEQGLRSGTLAVPLILGLQRALELCCADLDSEGSRLAALRDELRRLLLDDLPGVEENGDPQHRLPNTLNLTFRGVEGNALLASLPALAISSGSACTSADPAPSHVLLAMGRTAREAQASLRFSLGRPTTAAEVEKAAELVRAALARLRRR